MRQVAPPLAGKNLGVFADMVQKGNLVQVEGTHFRYADAQAKQLLGQWTGGIMNRKFSVQSGFRQAAQQINAFEAGAAREVGSGGQSLAVADKTAEAGLPAQIRGLPALFPDGGKQP